MSRIRVVPVSEQRRVRWRNGLGWTTEVCAEPPTGPWRWRLSLAESDGPAPFSSFPGIDRELVLVEGAGLRLTSADGSAVALEEGESHRFAGEDDIVGTPLDGPTRQLNVMWQRDQVTATGSVQCSDTEVPLPSSPTSHLVVYVAHGTCHLRSGTAAVPLTQGEAAVLTGGQSEAVDLTWSGWGVVITSQPLSPALTGP